MKKRALLPSCRYVTPGDLEAYLERRAAQGWILDPMRAQNHLCLSFLRTQPQKLCVVADFNPAPTPSYVGEKREAGWTLGVRLGPIFVWQQPYATQRPESFSDPDSLRQRSRRLRTTSLVILGTFTFALLLLAAGCVLSLVLDRPEKLPKLLAETLALALVCLYFGWFASRHARALRR